MKSFGCGSKMGFVLTWTVLPFLAAPVRGDVISVESEIRIGREAAGEVERQLPLSRDPLLRSRVERVGRRLAMVSGRPELPFEFHVIDAREVNAFALPGGFTYVYRGLLQAVPSDDALAFILGHEITHSVRRHAVKQFRKNTLVDLLSIPLRRVLGGGREWLRLIMQQLYSRDDESEADAMGLELSVKAGFSPDGGAQAMDTLLKMYGKGDSSLLILLQDHPATESRFKKLKARGEQMRSARPAPATPSADPVPPSSLLVASLAPTGPKLPASAACDYYPLASGNRWVYRVTNESGARRPLVLRVLEPLPDSTNAYRVETQMERTIAIPARVLTTAQALLRERGNAWMTEWSFVPGSDFRVSEEPVSVPHGTHPALRVERLAPDGRPLAIGWFVKGIGLVKRQSLTTGITEVLEVCELQRP